MDNKIENILVQILETQNTITEKLSGVQNIVNVLSDDVKELKSDVSILKSDVSTLKSDVKNLNTKMDTVYEQTSDLLVFKSATTASIKAISEDVLFIKHKIHKTEEEVFSIQSHLKIVK